LEESYGYLFRMLGHEMKRKADQRLKSYDITNEQGHTLGYIYAHQQDGLTQNDIVVSLQRKGSTVSSLLKNLENKKLIYRYVDANDTRRKNLGLTEAGRKLVESFTGVFDEIEGLMCAQFSKEENEKMKQNLMKMIKSLED